MRIRTQRVPVGYREVEYLESTGTQAIDTAVITSDSINIEITFSSTNITATRNYPIGTECTGYTNSRRTQLSYSMNSYAGWGADGQNITLSVDSQKHTMTLNSSALKIDNLDVYIPTSHNFSGGLDTKIYLFALVYNNNLDNVGVTTKYSEALKIYSCKIWNNNTLVRNFIPCIRTSDNKPGLYDTVHSTFYTNQGTGEFIKGPYKDSYKLSLLRLPSTYQEVEYIESTDGNQLLKIGSSDATKYYVKQSFNQLGTGRYTLQGYSSTWYGTADNSSYFQYADGNVTVTTSTLLSTNTIYEITLDSNGIKLNDTFFAYDQSRSKTWIKFGLFQIEDYPQFKFKGKVYNSKVFNTDNKVIKDLIPCYRKSDNVIGMYDIVEGKFYTNKGSGTFTKGNNVKNLGVFTPKMIMYNYNQLFYPMTSSSNWVSNESSVMYNSDESMTVTITGNVSYSGTQMSSSKASAFYANHKYFYSCWYYADTIAGNGASSGLNLYSTGSGYVIQEAQQYPEKTWYKDEKIFTVSKNSSGTIYPWIFINQRGDRNIGDKVTLKNVMFIDLTDWYGAGKEPSTVTEFKERFYRDYYGNCSKSIKLTENMINAEPTYRYNQILNLNGSSGQNGINFKVENNHITATGTCTSSFNVELTSFKFNLTDTHQYLLTNYSQHMPISELGYASVQLYTSGGPYYGINENHTENYIRFTSYGSSNKQYYMRFRFEQGKTYNMDYYCNLIDLTTWFSSNENIPTVANFKSMFPYKNYPYSTKKILNKYMINELGTN